VESLEDRFSPGPRLENEMHHDAGQYNLIFAQLRSCNLSIHSTLEIQAFQAKILVNPP
jgi:hypothetical protein